MKHLATEDGAAYPPEIPTDRPTSARVYGWMLGSKDNFQVDREMALGFLDAFPETLDDARDNRRFLYRVVRHLARDVGITQFLDLGSGLPTDSNVHQVAQAFQPDARVVYVDNDPIVTAHGRALLNDDASTTVIQADVTDPRGVLDAPETRELIDFTRPVGVLMLATAHCVPDDDQAREAILAPMAHAAPGSYLAVTHVVADDQATADEITRHITAGGMPWRTRTPEEFQSWLEDFELLDPGLVPVADWRPDPDQPPLPEVDTALTQFLGAASRGTKRGYEFGGLLRKA
ncbi:SAM-dependent methyltransferase [Spiractinospora alimapuensis]|nr:SAM-dependent methyltransferase [Spiractinospora alimapuensis]